MQRWRNLEGASLPKPGEGVVAACCRQRRSLCGWAVAGLQLLGEQEAAFWVACEPQLRTDTQACRHAGEAGMLLWVRGLAGLVSTLGEDRWAEGVGEPVRVWSVMSLFLGLSESDHQAKLGLWVCQGIYTLYKNIWYTKEVALHMHGEKKGFFNTLY